MKTRSYFPLGLTLLALLITVAQTNATLVLTCATNKIVDCDSVWSFDPPTAFDDCTTANSNGTTNVTITIQSTVTDSACPPVFTRTWRAFDACSNSVTCNQTVTVDNMTLPVVICASNKTVECGTAWSFDVPTVVGACCDATITILSTVSSGSPCQSFLTRIWQVSDCCNNVTICTQSVTVVDTTPPFFIWPTPQQNLVPNPGFESYSSCPDFYSELSRAALWFQATTATPDLFNTCASFAVGVPANFAGNQAPHSGQGYAGEYAVCCGIWREYIETPLLAPLAAGHIYEVSFYVSLSDHSHYAVDNLGAYFSVGSVEDYTSYGPLPFTPQVQNPAGNFLTSVADWMLVRGTFTATSVEDHLTIGNFYGDPNTPIAVAGGSDGYSYYYVDDVAVRELSAPCPTNKTVQCGDNWTFDTPTAFDACSGTNVPVTVQSTVTNGTCPQLITQTWVATDACGNSNTCSQTVTVLQLPTVLCPSSMVVTTSCTSVAVNYPAPATNNCCSPLTVVCTPPSGTVLAPGTVTNVHCVATDCCSNSATCDFTVTVVRPPTVISASPTNGPAPLGVSFAYNSPCDILAARWVFGDGFTTNFTTGTGPAHTYTDPGLFQPLLIITDGGIDITNALPNPIVVQSAFNYWQFLHFNCSNCPQAAAAADPDGDGMSNTNEFLAGTDPTNSASAFRIISLLRQATNIVLTWATAGGRTNAVQTAPGNANGDFSTNFADLSGPIVISGSGDAATNYTDTGGATNVPSQYYRIRLVP